MATSERLTYSVKEAAGLLGLSKNSAYQACLTGQIPHLKIGKRILIPGRGWSKCLMKPGRQRGKMANPQLENGHTRVANELMEQLMKLYLAPNQWQILVCIIRKTYGFHKKVDYMTNTQICEATGLVKSTVSRGLDILKGRNIVTRDGKHIGFQKDWEQWLTWEEWQKLADKATKVSVTANSVDGEKLADREQKLAVTQPKLADRATKVSSPLDTQKEDTIQKKLSKRKHGEFQNVLLTDEEYQKLKDRLNTRADEFIEKLSAYMKSHGKRYKDHYATILNWYQREKEGKGATIRNSRELPKVYTESPAYADL